MDLTTSVLVSDESEASGKSVVAPSSRRKVRSPIGTRTRLPAEAAGTGKLPTRRDVASRARRRSMTHRSVGRERGVWRSEEVCLAQLLLQPDAAFACVAQLGELGIVQFRDLNPSVSSFQRKYVNEVRRCDELERKLRYLRREMKNEGIELAELAGSEEAHMTLPDDVIDLDVFSTSPPRLALPNIRITEPFEKLEKELRESNRNEEKLKKNHAELIELKHILRKTQGLFEEMDQRRARFVEGRNSTSSHPDEPPLITTVEDDEAIHSREISLHILKLRFVTGVIQRERLPAFEKLLWRVCRGNAFLKTADIDDDGSSPNSSESADRAVFIIFFQGEQLHIKIRKICESFRAHLHPCPETPQERREMSIEVATRIEDLNKVLAQTQQHKHRVLVAASKNLRMWLTKVLKIKFIYHTLNLFNFDVTQRCLIAEVWCPEAELDLVKQTLKRATNESGCQVPSILHKIETNKTLPTFHRTNKFTRGFQNIVDAYGIANYGEINPAPYIMISFPFLFAVMFGDIGHGILMLAVALFFILKEKQLETANINNEIFQTFFSGRYVILLMGAFSIYTGFMYNEVFAKSIAIFDSSWVNPYKISSLRASPHDQIRQLSPEHSYLGSPYPIGVDPVWNLAETNKLIFLNSMKMKMAVLLGIGQMTFGLILSFYNHKYFKSDLDIKFMFIPQMLFLSCIFIYLCLQIIIKWIFFSWKADSVFGFSYPGASCLINMLMMKSRPSGFVNENGESISQCHLNYWYPGQELLEKILVLVAICCIPVMLFVKPFLQFRRHHKMARSIHTSRNLTVRINMSTDEAEIAGTGSEELAKVHTPQTSHSHSQKEFDPSDVLVNQSIQTIEFVLGCISHTASYLRLWALSLAHAQLSEVLWKMVFAHAFRVEGYMGAIVTYVLFFIFAFLSVFILVIMEGLSAFLHTLRLHWVEFQSKFYSGNGSVFTPFCLNQINLSADLSMDNSHLDEDSILQ
ncbi:hypothetical protein WR25_17451 [Diploscapter pachys]|uniref:V-type proton ATPase subunit a n=1 Tax=Diploscapter pachys TaxID=2018661 RepID=A0A2A2J7H5_9BILA|nr:hypothetical protein WR25_17451 [Diploscapter pachys]